MTPPPPIKTPSLMLRQFIPEDAAKVFCMSREAGMREWIPDQVYENERAALDVLQYLIAQYGPPANPASSPYVLGICLHTTAELIGHVGLSPIRDQVEIGYAIEQKWQRRGFATQAVSAMAGWGLRFFGLSKILGIVSEENITSCKVLENAGFVLEQAVRGQLHGRRGMIRTYNRTPAPMEI